MHALAIGPSPDEPGLPVHDLAGQPPYLLVRGAEGSALRATAAALTVCQGPGAGGPGRRPDRTWSYGQLSAVTIEDRESLAIIRGTIRATATLLPLLLVERAELAAARHVIELVQNLIDRSTSNEGGAA